MSNAATLHFHSFAAKSAFIKRNRIQSAEILAETSGSITITNGADFINSPYVYDVTQ